MLTCTACGSAVEPGAHYPGPRCPPCGAGEPWPPLGCIDWLAAGLLPLLAAPPPGGPSYAVSVWCGEDDGAGEPPFGWVEVARGFRAGAWRRVWKYLLACSWDESSVHVRREDGDG